MTQFFFTNFAYAAFLFQMALNIAVPLTTVADLMDGFGLLSPISPLSVDCRGVMAAAAAAAAAGTHNKSKQLVSPVGSESSGVSSLDSDEMKVRRWGGSLS